MEVLQRIKNNIQISGNGCWIWLGGKTSAGYGEIFYKRKVWYVHRLIAHLYLGLTWLDDPRLVLHKNSCHNPSCCNPEHLYLGDNADNMRDKAKLITYCINNHEFTEENTLITSQGKRRCRKCHRERNLKSYHSTKSLSYENFS